MFDLAEGVYRLRPLTEGPLDLQRLEYRNQRERIAHDLLVRRGAVYGLAGLMMAGDRLAAAARSAADGAREMTADARRATAEEPKEPRPNVVTA